MSEYSMREIIEAIDTSTTAIQEQITVLRQEMNQRFDNHETRLERLETRLGYLETRMERSEKWLSNVVTKQHFERLLKILERKEILNKYETAHITFTEPGI